MYNRFLKTIYPLCHWWWIHWSNVRWSKVERHSEEIDCYNDLKDFDSIQAMIKDIYNNHYTWTADNVDQLFDAICPPPYNYYRYKTKPVLKDDCDGFHSLVYHFLHCNGYECYLLSLVDFRVGHCVLAYKSNDKWYVINYTKIYGGYESLSALIENYNAEYSKQQKIDKISANGLVEYDYKKGKLKNKKLNK